MRNVLASLFIFSALCGSTFASQAVDDLLAEFSNSASETFNAERGEFLWRQPQFEQRICSECHGTNVGLIGKHSNTGKIIEPMAVSVNTERLTDRKNIEKWLYRNCKYTFNRECSAQEKGDILTWLSQQ